MQVQTQEMLQLICDQMNLDYRPGTMTAMTDR